MTVKNRTTMERAIGIIEGVSFAVDNNLSEALCNALEMLESVLRDEEHKR